MWPFTSVLSNQTGLILNVKDASYIAIHNCFMFCKSMGGFSKDLFSAFLSLEAEGLWVGR